jgi:hypothetical protein
MNVWCHLCQRSVVVQSTGLVGPHIDRGYRCINGGLPASFVEAMSKMVLKAEHDHIEKMKALSREVEARGKR